jgi:hypothetical protein
MENISASNFSMSSNMQSNLGFNSNFRASSLAAENRSSFGGFDIEKLASALIEAVKTGNLPEGLLEMLAAVLSPVEAGQLLAAIEKLLSGEGTQGNSPAPQNANTGETQTNNGPSAGETGSNNTPRSGETTGSNRTGNSTPTTSAPTSTSTPQAPTSDTRITTRAPDSANIPSVEAIANDPVVAAAIEKSWNASNPNTPGSKQEQGFWVMRDDKTGALSTVNFPSNGTRDSLTPGAVPSIEGKTAVAFFHTHPNTTAEGYTNGPSPADQNFADARGIPGIIQSHNGMYYFNPRN